MSATGEHAAGATGSLRSDFYATRPISRDMLVPEDASVGLIAFASPNDPEPSLRIADGRVVELDGTAEADFDLIDEFIARHGLDLAVAEEAMAVETGAFARMLVDPACRARRDRAPLRGHDAGQAGRARWRCSAPVELMSAMQKLRVRRTPSIQAHVTNRVDHPLLLAADAAAAVALGFRELETTVPLLRDAPLNAIALLVGGQVAARRRADAVRGRGAHRARARHARPHDLRRDGLGLRHRGGLRRRRRHALVEGLPGRQLRLARAQDALHLGLGSRVPDGRRPRASRCSTSRRAASR